MSGVRCLVTFRMMGDDLDPDLLTEALVAAASVSHRAGDVLSRPGRPDVVRRSGLWLTQAPRSAGEGPEDQCAWLVGFLRERAPTIRALLADGGLTLDAALFWAGPPGAAAPDCAVELESLVTSLGGTYERDVLAVGRR